MTLINKYEEIPDNNLAKTKLFHWTNNAALDTYNFNIVTFEPGNPKVVIQLLIFFDKTVISTVTTKSFGIFFLPLKLSPG